MRVLIAGCGDVGTELGLLLTGQGHEVWGLRRHPDSLPSPIRPLAADLGDPETLRDLPAFDYVAYTAAADGHGEDAYRRAYVAGVRHLLAALPGPPRRFLFTSSTGVYGQTEGEWIDEGSATEPRSFTGTALLEGEGLVLGAGFPTTVVRLAGIYGPGRTRLVRLVRSGEAKLSKQPSYTNRIHRDDCAGFLAHLIAMDVAGKAVDEVYVGVDDDPAERGEVLAWLADQLGVRRPLVEAEPSKRGQNKRCRNQKLRSTGYQLRFPSFREGYAAVLDDLDDEAALS